MKCPMMSMPNNWIIDVDNNIISLKYNGYIFKMQQQG